MGTRWTIGRGAHEYGRLKRTGSGMDFEIKEPKRLERGGIQIMKLFNVNTMFQLHNVPIRALWVKRGKLISGLV